MTSPAEQERTALDNLVVALAYSQTADVVTDALGLVAGVSAAGVRALFEIPQVRGIVRLAPKPGAHAAVQAMNRLNLFRRASYLVTAARRMTTAARMGPRELARALVVERRWLQQHLQASAHRQVVASAVAATARQLTRDAKNTGEAWNGLLGWYAVNDAVTSPECRKAGGRNFDPAMVPPIGYPGAVHGSCRCRPGPPHNTDRRVEDLALDPANAVFRPASAKHRKPSPTPRRVILRT